MMVRGMSLDEIRTIRHGRQTLIQYSGRGNGPQVSIRLTMVGRWFTYALSSFMR